MKVQLSDEAQLALDNIVKILDGNHKILHNMLKELISQNEMTKETLDEFAKMRGASEDAR